MKKMLGQCVLIVIVIVLGRFLGYGLKSSCLMCRLFSEIAICVASSYTGFSSIGSVIAGSSGSGIVLIIASLAGVIVLTIGVSLIVEINIMLSIVVAIISFILLLVWRERYT